MAGKKRNAKGSGREALPLSEQELFENEIYDTVVKYRDIDLAWEELKKKRPGLGRWRVSQEVPRSVMVALRIKDKKRPFAGTLLMATPNVGLKS